MTDEIIEGVVEGESHLTVKAFSREYVETRDLGYSLDGAAYSHEDVRAILMDLLSKLTWIAGAKDVRRVRTYDIVSYEDTQNAGFNEGLDVYQLIIKNTLDGLENLRE